MSYDTKRYNRLIDAILIITGCIGLAFQYGIKTGAAVMCIAAAINDVRKYQ